MARLSPAFDATTDKVIEAMDRKPTVIFLAVMSLSPFAGQAAQALIQPSQEAPLHHPAAGIDYNSVLWPGIAGATMPLPPA